jgi:hypothetical protein
MMTQLSEAKTCYFHGLSPEAQSTLNNRSTKMLHFDLPPRLAPRDTFQRTEHSKAILMQSVSRLRQIEPFGTVSATLISLHLLESM